MNFLDSIKSGIAKAEVAEQNVTAVATVFRELNMELSNYSDGKIKLARTTSLTSKLSAYVGAVSKESPEKDFFKMDLLALVSIDFKIIYDEVAKWRQHVNGYPCTLTFEGQEYICDSVEDLMAALRELLSSVSFGKALSNAMKKANGGAAS
ncbi:hypothetical protein [Pseudomonas sp. fls2-241-R2A-110]|uniref:hypothetical protein n=1 Tax=Pseudomonas sp. fls2-241-R2A-110 TaxID=3040311 RepID=UPI002555F4CE|nr:hypothetical protein [Pseudomonas sp. fls2-241-R2A-110]